MLRSFVNLTLFSLLLPSAAIAQPNFAFFEPVTPPRPVQVVVNGGLAIAAPENSKPALELCVQDYCEWARVDVRLTRDGQHVLIREPDIDAVTDGHGQVSAHAIAELQQLDAGSWFAPRFARNRLLSLPEALKLAKGKLNLVLTCHSIRPEQLVAEIRAAGMERQVLLSGDAETLAQIHAIAGHALARLVRSEPSIDLAALLGNNPPAVIELDAAQVSPELCQRCRAAGVRVQARTVGDQQDQPATWSRLLAAGVDRILTDDPAGVLFLSAHRRLGAFPVLIACHRGASRYAPENTLPAITSAARLGVDYVEIDIRTTRDGHTVLMHDGKLDRTTTGQGPVKDRLASELSSLSAGAWFGGPRYAKLPILTFAEGLNALGEKLSVYLDAKDIAPETLVAAIRQHHLEQRHVVYQSFEYCQRLRSIDPTVRTMPPLKHPDQLATVAASHPYAVDVSWPILSQELIDNCHQHGIKVFSDALGPFENIPHYRQAIAQGIDCIQTDHPLRVLRAIELNAIPKETGSREE